VELISLKYKNNISKQDDMYLKNF